MNMKRVNLVQHFVIEIVLIRNYTMYMGVYCVSKFSENYLIILSYCGFEWVNVTNLIHYMVFLKDNIIYIVI